MPASELEDPPGEGLQVVETLGTAAAQIESDRPYTGSVQVEYLLVGCRGRKLGHADEPRAQLREGRLQRLLIETLKGSRDDGSAREGEAGGALEVIEAGERLGEVSVVCHQRKAGIDDVEVTIENLHGRDLLRALSSGGPAQSVG